MIVVDFQTMLRLNGLEEYGAAPATLGGFCLLLLMTLDTMNNVGDVLVDNRACLLVFSSFINL